MAKINPMLMEKIDNLDVNEQRKQLIKSLFEAQIMVGSEPKDRPYRISRFKEILAKELRE